MKSLINNLVMREKIETTEERAKEIRPIVEKLLTIGKKQSLASLRLLIARVSKASAQKIYYDIALRYSGKAGGYLRIIKSAKRRKADGARMAIIEFV